MYHFVELSLSFPVVLFSFLMVLAFAWLTLASLGLLGSETLDMPGSGVDGVPPGALAAVLFKAGMADVPFVIILSLMAVMGWLISYFVQLLLLSRLAPGAPYYVLGVLVTVSVLVVAFRLTAAIVCRARPLMRRINGPVAPPLCGQVAIVRSAIVSRSKGQAALGDGGAGLLLQVRTDSANGFKRADRVVLLHYLAEEHAYLVISESELTGQAHQGVS